VQVLDLPPDKAKEVADLVSHHGRTDCSLLLRRRLAQWPTSVAQAVGHKPMEEGEFKTHTGEIDGARRAVRQCVAARPENPGENAGLTRSRSVAPRYVHCGPDALKSAVSAHLCDVHTESERFCRRIDEFGGQIYCFSQDSYRGENGAFERYLRPQVADSDCRTHREKSSANTCFPPYMSPVRNNIFVHSNSSIPPTKPF